MKYTSVFSVLRYLPILFYLLISCKQENDGELIFSSLGKIKDGDTTVFATLKNVGGKNVQLEDYTSSCECFSLSEMKNYVIKPGDSTKILFKLAPKTKERKIPITVTIKHTGKPRFLTFSFLR